MIAEFAENKRWIPQKEGSFTPAFLFLLVYAIIATSTAFTGRVVLIGKTT